GNEINLVGSNIFAKINTFAGNSPGGNIFLNSKKIHLDDSEISARAMWGKGGSIDIQSEILDVFGSRITSASFGDGGNVSILSDNVTLNDISFIVAEAIFGIGGSISIEAESITASWGSIFAISNQQGGDINITGTGPGSSLALNSSLISTDLGYNSENPDSAGDITVSNFDTITLSNRTLITSSIGPTQTSSPGLKLESGGNAGNISINALSSISLANQSSISTTSTVFFDGSVDNGPGGLINLQAPSISLAGGDLGGSSIDSSTRGEDSAGTIDIQGPNLAGSTLNITDSDITSSTFILA
ncbi:MAG: hypothetical protein GWN14_00815, partial [candidate division Zixibacteria bacterium]|nr:hypothetical protein [Gammaproteobacteria bacterium]NIX54502.1 hypothetical protein [candidate division Zixibacteria bacterium]